MAAVAAACGQQFESPTDLVETLYNSYFDDLPIDDLAPYLSDDLTRQMSGKVGMSEFKMLGFDPIVGDPNWEPRNFRTELASKSADNAEVKVSFTTKRTPVSITIDLVREPRHGWQIDHIAGRAGERTWCTNDIVALRPANGVAD
jgi:hypothetical protein